MSRTGPASLDELDAGVRACRNCDLWEGATQAVPGEGPRRARVLLAGEQPGDEEDREGRPFVGPAGTVLDRALKDAGIERSEAYVTNVVKHFRWRPAGKRRLHQRPTQRHIHACRPWFEREVAAVAPALIVCLGATAAQAVFGSSFRIGRQRGQVLPTDLGPPALITIHPSAVLREPDDEARQRARLALAEDLRVLRRYMDR